jgi:hypothetical protein
MYLEPNGNRDLSDAGQRNPQARISHRCGDHANQICPPLPPSAAAVSRNIARKAALSAKYQSAKQRSENSKEEK